MLTQDQIKANINAMEQQGASQSEIQQYLDSLKGSTTNTPQPSTPESGFLKNVLQSLVHVPATLVSTLASLGADVKSFAGAAGSGFKTMDFSEGDKIRQQGLDLGIFGNVKPVGGDINNQTFGGLAGNVAGLAGNAALDVATLGSDSLAKAVGESTLKQVGNIAAKNAGIGAGYGLASSVENGDNWLDTLLHTVEGAAVGGIAGPALHYAIPAVAKTVGGVASDVIDKGVLGGLESTANKKEIKDLIAKKGKGLGKNTSLKDELTIPENSLISEAKKYKSAEEFVKAQGQTLYHGTPLNISELKNTRLGENNYGRGGVFLTPDKQEAFTYGGGYLTPDKTNARVLEVYVNPSAKIKEIDGKKLFNNENVRDNQIAPLVRKAEQEGYDGVVIRNTWTTSKTKNLYSRKVELESLRRSKVFSDIEEMVLTDKTIKNGKDYEIKYNNLVKESADATKITNRIKEIEKQISELDQRHIVIFNDNVLKTKSQLEDIWNKANKTNEALKKEESKSDKPNKSGLVKTLKKTAEKRGVKLKKEEIPRLASKMPRDLLLKIFLNEKQKVVLTQSRHK